MLNIKKILNKLYNNAVYLNHSHIYSLLEKNKNAVFLDLGCDDGKITIRLAKTIGTKKIYGVDVITQKLKAAKKVGIRVSNSDLNHPLKFSNNYFDVIHGNQIIEHLYDSDNFLKEIYRILKPGGYAIISTENASSWCNIFSSIFGWQIFSLVNFSNLRESIGNPLSLHKDNNQGIPSWNHVRIFNFFGLREYLQVAGFNIVKVKGAGYFPFPSKIGNLDKIHAHFITFKIRKGIN